MQIKKESKQRDWTIQKENGMKMLQELNITYPIFYEIVNKIVMQSYKCK